MRVGATDARPVAGVVLEDAEVVLEDDEVGADDVAAVVVALVVLEWVEPPDPPHPAIATTHPKASAIRRHLVFIGASSEVGAARRLRRERVN
jgi:hypothetical protein